MKRCNLYTQPSNLQLVEEEKLRGTPAQERERLLQQVKDDNAEISTMERQITEMQEKVRAIDIPPIKSQLFCVVPADTGWPKWTWKTSR